MWTRRNFLKHSVNAGVVAAAISTRLANGAGEDSPVSNTTAEAVSRRSKSRIRSAVRRDESIVRYGGSGDNWHMSWASDDQQYVSLCDGLGFSARPKAHYNSRMLAIGGGPRDAKFYDVLGYPMLGAPAQGPTDARYYNFGTLALDGGLYQFLSTFNRVFQPDEKRLGTDALMRFVGAKLIYSQDHGRTWCNQDGSTPVVWESWGKRSRETMVFFEEDQEAFSLLTVLQMGKNYEHNRDGYVYVYAPNGNTEGTMNELVMFRVPKGKLLDRSRYEYFAGRQASGGAEWTSDIQLRRVVHTFPRGWVNTLIHPYAWHPSVVYNAPLNVYLMANWGMGTAADGSWFGKPSYLGFWTAPNPWGPWTQIHEETAWLPGGDRNARAYQPQIAPKWIAPDGKSFWVVWTDFQGFDEYMRHAVPTISSEADVQRTAMLVRKHMPYYAFNVQRVDLVMG